MLAIPNVSEGRDPHSIARMSAAIHASEANLLDTHSDPAHHRSVFTVAGTPDQLLGSMLALALIATEIDLTNHVGVHPRLGGLDVCPFVPFEGSTMDEAVDLARSVGRNIGERLGIPVFLYGEAADGRTERDLPEIRRGGLAGSIERSQRGRRPDFGPATIDPVRGVVCIGARSTLIAFNVWLECDVGAARKIASEVRKLPGVRALGLAMGGPFSQVSMNLIAPEETSIDAAFDAVETAAVVSGVLVTGTEIVGLVPERHLPDPEREAARKLIAPGRSLESVLRG